MTIYIPEIVVQVYFALLVIGLIFAAHMAVLMIADAVRDWTRRNEFENLMDEVTTLFVK